MAEQETNQKIKHKNRFDTMTPEQQLEDALVHMEELGNHLYRRFASSMQECQLAFSPAQICLLTLLSRLGPQRMSDLATLLGITQSGCTALVDRLWQAGLAERERDPSDRRVVWVKLTPEGNLTLDEVRHMKAQLLARYLRRLNPDELQQLANLLDRLVDIMLDEIRLTEQQPVLESS